MKLTSSFQDRPKHIQKSKGHKFDLTVVGGGITGAGVARDAAMRGLSVCLIERGDFAEGTSSRSSKLAHGGLRYLENLEFDLVSEALHERQNLLRMAPHMVKPLRFLMPIYQGDRVSPFKMKLGMILYDLLAAFNTPRFHESLSSSQIQERYPKLKSEGLRSGFLYSDALMDDDRLVFETLRSAVDHGAVVMNYVEAVSYGYDEEGAVITCKDKITGDDFHIESRHTVSCVGPWTDQFAEIVDSKWSKRTRPSKGVHITIPKDKLNLDSAVVMAADKQKRILFCIPREGFDVIGTTDTDFIEDPSSVRTEKKDVDYIIKVLKEYYPDVEIKYEDVLFSYAGVRPLIDDGSASESKVSRSHWIKTDLEKKVTYISGGKYTTYLAMAEDCVDQVMQSTELGSQGRKKVNTRDHFVEFNSAENNTLARKKILENKSINWSESERLSFIERHGAQAVDFLRRYPGLSSIEVEAHVAIDFYFCANLNDFFNRRVPDLLRGEEAVKKNLDKVSDVFKIKLFLSEEDITDQKNKLQKTIDFESAWRDSTY
jgi:glycerol-3-phosphate dehydrogenase